MIFEMQDDVRIQAQGCVLHGYIIGIHRDAEEELTYDLAIPLDKGKIGVDDWIIRDVPAELLDRVEESGEPPDVMDVLFRVQARFTEWLEQVKQADHYLEVRELLNMVPAHFHIQQAIKIINEEIASARDVKL